MKIRLQAHLITICLCTGLPSGLYAQTPPADLAWNQLLAKNDFRQQPAVASEWTGIVRAAEEFARDYPADDRAKSARRIALSVRVRAQKDEPVLSGDLLAATEGYLADTGNGVRDRLKLRMDLEQLQLQRLSGRTMGEALGAKATFAQNLIREFPTEPEGYGVLLSVAKLAEPEIASALARELLASSGPESVKGGARRVLDRIRLQGRRLNLVGAAPPFPADQGKPVILYSWTVSDEGFLRIIRRHAQSNHVVFVGVNLDADVASAKVVATTLPGTQYFDGAGLEGLLARQLCLLSRTSLYLLDGQGIVRELNGNMNPEALLVAAAGMGGGR